MKKVSIILPVYNLEEYIHKCLDSIINQTYNNLEIIVVNDGSKDRSLEIINQYKTKDSRIIVLDQPNKGSSASRNRALNIVTGDYIFFIDGDDYLVQADSIEKLVTKAEKDNLDILMFHYHNKSDNTKNWNYYSIKEISKGIFKGTQLGINFFKLDFYSWNNFFRTSFIKQYNIPFPLIYYEDIFWVSFYRLRANRISALEEVIYFYGYNPQSITCSGGLKAFDIFVSFYMFRKENQEYFKDINFKKYFSIFLFFLTNMHIEIIIATTKFRDILKLKNYFKIKHLKNNLISVKFDKEKDKNLLKMYYLSPKELKRLSFLKKSPSILIFFYIVIRKLFYSLNKAKILNNN